jgi:hypothetical protein
MLSEIEMLELETFADDLAAAKKRFEERQQLLQAKCAGNKGHLFSRTNPPGSMIAVEASRWCFHCGADRKK